MAIEPETKDWTWVLERPCDQCGFDPAGLARTDVAARIAASAAGWDTVLARPDATTRPNDHTWSPLEYACHVRDVHDVMRERLNKMLADDGVAFDDWSQDAAADSYPGTDPTAVAAQITDAATRLAADYAAVTDEQWGRRGLRGNGAAFTVETLAAYAIHDVEHHRVDVGLPARQARH